MGASHLRGKAADYLRLARGAKEIDKEIEAAAAPGRHDEASNFESDERER